MSSGNKNLVFNTRERAISSDFNREQAFAAYERSEVLRYKGAIRQSSLGGEQTSLELGGFQNTVTALLAPIQNPIIADVFDGLVVNPIPSSLNLAVTPGAVGLVDPDGQAGSSDPDPPSDDDSRYKVVVDPGVQILGALTVAAGAGGTRIDLVEVQRQTVVLETDSRDVFDPSTGVFVPVTVDKVSVGRLTYRVRQGTPGAGIPALVQGWLPLCVISVPSSATSVDTMTFWDVRPTVADRVTPGHELRHKGSTLGRESALFADDLDAVHTYMTGVVTGSIGIYQCGGYIEKLDARAAANHASGYGPAAGQPWFLYAVFPAGLPRWVRYADFPSARLPNGPRGVMVVSEQGPSGDFNDPFATLINPPTASGLGTNGPAALLAAGAYSTQENGFILQDGLITHKTGSAFTLSPSATTATTDSYNLPANLKFPRCAKSVLIEFNTTFAGSLGDVIGIGTTCFVVYNGVTTRYVEVGQGRGTQVVPAGGSLLVIVIIEVPVIPFAAAVGLPTGDLNVEIQWITSVSRGSSAARVYGWRF